MNSVYMHSLHHLVEFSIKLNILIKTLHSQRYFFGMLVFVNQKTSAVVMSTTASTNCHMEF